MDVSLFADDLPIYMPTRNQKIGARALQGVTNKLDAWAAVVARHFPPNKTVSIIFRKRNEEPIEIMQRNKIILSKESTNFVGMTLDSRLNWGEHINKLRTKVKRALNTIKVVAEKK